MARRNAESPGLPSRDALLTYLAERFRAGATNVTRRELVREFAIPADRRADLRDLLHALEREGVLQRPPKGASPADARRARKALPEMLVLLVTGADPEDETLETRPLLWTEDSAPPVILLDPGNTAPTVGDRVLARLSRGGALRASAIRVIETPPDRVVGMVEPAAPGARLRPTDRRNKEEFVIGPADLADAEPGELVLAELIPDIGRRPLGLRAVRVIERLGRLGDPRAVSLICIYQLGIPDMFSADALAEAEAAAPVALAARTDLRPLKLITIDGEDARDFDDAVFAEPDSDPGNPGGWHLIVAIADVAHYVQPGSALDLAAWERGNSVYFPDRVVPMLPEALSNNLCSLRPDEDRACLAVHIWIDALGNKLQHRFVRGLMRSHARLTYNSAQALHDDPGDDGALRAEVLRPLFGAYRSLLVARERRGTLDLDLPERLIKIEDGKVTAIQPRPRFDSHKLIEEFMILANVCAAESLEASGQPCMYRIHDAPSDEKLETLREFLASLDLRLAKGQVVKPRHFMQLLQRAEGSPHQRLLNEVVLRSQAQAAYSPENIGHFGLALVKYAHFTSPIRRYADLCVHRALIRGLNLPETGALPSAHGLDWFIETATHISSTERRAAQAEREAVERYVAAYLADRVGAEFAATINGVTSFGLFITLTDTQAGGLIPMRALPRDYYHYDEGRQRLVGERYQRTYVLGDALSVRLMDADAVTGSLVFAPTEAGDGDDAPAPSPQGRRRGPPTFEKRTLPKRGKKRGSPRK